MLRVTMHYKGIDIILDIIDDFDTDDGFGTVDGFKRIDSSDYINVINSIKSIQGLIETIAPDRWIMLYLLLFSEEDRE